MFASRYRTGTGTGTGTTGTGPGTRLTRSTEVPAAKAARQHIIGGKMAVTRSTAARARLVDLLSLPDDLLLKVARHALAMEVPAALRLVQTCKALQAAQNATRNDVATARINERRRCLKQLAQWGGYRESTGPRRGGPTASTLLDEVERL